MSDSSPPWVTSDRGRLNEVNTTPIQIAMTEHFGAGTADRVSTSMIPVDGPMVSLSPEQSQQLAIFSIAGRYKRFMPVAAAYAQLSKYPGTRVGAVVVGSTLEVRSSGWNGAPRGCAADEDSRLLGRANRLTWASHAEANAITNAARTGTPLAGCVMVVTHMPCMTCAKLIVQAGITTVVTVKPEPAFAAKWAEDFDNARALFKECSVMLHESDSLET